MYDYAIGSVHRVEESDKTGQLSRPNRSRSIQADGVHSTRKSTKRKHMSESSDFNNSKTPRLVGEEDSNAQGVPPVPERGQHRESILWDVPSVSSGTPSSGSPDGGTSDLEDLIPRTNDRARSSVSKDITHRGHSTLPRSSTPDSSALRHIDNQRTHSSKGPELVESDYPLMGPLTSQPNSSAPAPARFEQPRPAVKPGVEVFVIAARGSRVTIKKWPGGSLKDKELDTIFAEVSALIVRNDIQSINFKLETLNKEDALEFFIDRSEKEAFELMVQRFNQRMKERRQVGEARFKISLEPEFERQGAAEAEAAQVSQICEDNW